MAFARARAARTLQAALRPQRAGPVRTQLPRLTQAGQRRWQSGGHGSGHGSSEGSDIPWLIGAIAITVPGTWYLWPAPHSADAHHHGSEHEEHAEEEGSKGETEDSQEESAPAEQADDAEKGSKDEKKDEDSKDEKKDDDSKDEKKDDDSKKEEKKGDDSKDEKKGDDTKEEEPQGNDSKKSTYASNPAGKDAPQFKGKMKEDAEGQSDSRKSESLSDSKGDSKKRIDSGYQKDLGGKEEHGDAATAKTQEKTSGGDGDIGSKQKGLSNTATRHSTQIDEDPEKSKKAEGTPETAKSMGTVDPSRPAK